MRLMSNQTIEIQGGFQIIGTRDPEKLVLRCLGCGSESSVAGPSSTAVKALQPRHSQCARPA